MNLKDLDCCIFGFEFIIPRLHYDGIDSKFGDLIGQLFLGFKFWHYQGCSKPMTRHMFGYVQPWYITSKIMKHMKWRRLNQVPIVRIQRKTSNFIIGKLQGARYISHEGGAKVMLKALSPSRPLQISSL
jgi:hypothetical protein